MKIKPVFYASVRNGGLVYQDPARLRNYLLGFPEGTEIEVSPRKKFKRRTSGKPGELTDFNGYYWGVIVRMIADERGEIGEKAYNEIHQWIQIQIGNFREMPGGIKIANDTSDMEGGDFSEMCSRARMWANIPGNVCEYGLYIPEPYEQLLEE